MTEQQMQDTIDAGTELRHSLIKTRNEIIMSEVRAIGFMIGLMISISLSVMFIKAGRR